MNKSVSLTINGRSVLAKPGETIIQVADREGIDIPRFCYHKHLSVVANCRMCLVEVHKASKPLPACATEVTAGMSVDTRSKVTVDAQRAVMEFLLINHPLDCPICDQGGECELQDVAMEFGEGVSRFEGNKRVVNDENLGPLIAADMTRCIHCSRCVRFGVEIAGQPELGATGRGGDMRIGTYLEKGVRSELSGNMIDLCPVGALTSKPFRFQGRSWGFKRHLSLGVHDCVGSNLFIHTVAKGYDYENTIMRVLPRENHNVNQTWISNRDRFSYSGLEEQRLLHPEIKVNEMWRKVSWEKAFSVVKERLTQLIESKGVKQLGVLMSESASLEEYWMAKKWTDSLKCPNIDHRIKQMDCCYQKNYTSPPGLSFSLKDLESADAIVLIEANLQDQQPMINHRVRQASLKGAAVFSITSSSENDNYEMKGKCLVHPLKLAWTLHQLMEQVLQIKAGKTSSDNQDLLAMANLLLASKKVRIILGTGVLHHPHAETITTLAHQLNEQLQGQWGQLTDGCNSQGAWLAGCVPSSSRSMGKGLTAPEMFKAGLAGYVLHGIEPDLDTHNPAMAMKALKAAECVVSLNSFDSDALREVADVLLPMAAFTESSGSYVNVCGEKQSSVAAIHPPGEARPAWKVYRVLGNIFKLQGFDEGSLKDVQDQLPEVPTKIGQYDTSSWTGTIKESKTLPLRRYGHWPSGRVDGIVRRSKPLQAGVYKDSQSAKMHSKTAKHYQLENKEVITIKQGEVLASVEVVIDDSMPPSCVRLDAGLDVSTQLAGLFDAISVVKNV
ncbi:MAG TPA: NADH-quinone oxidoreductase subunit NuoG [Gammaproteobacteria bacterium]|nr:NADH-quinone oxidoreductase subunit NuoG [Gammaproteobacteria bacterium]